MFDFPGAFADTRQLVDALKMTATTDYGAPGPAFVRGVIAPGRARVADWARAAIEKFVKKHAPQDASEQVGRVARKLASSP